MYRAFCDTGYTPAVEAGTKWFDKLTILSKVEGQIG